MNPKKKYQESFKEKFKLIHRLNRLTAIHNHLLVLMMMLLFSMNPKSRRDWNLLKYKIIPSLLIHSITFKQKIIKCFKILKNKIIRFNMFQAKMKEKMIKAHG
jgi:hypothetical protein